MLVLGTLGALAAIFAVGAAYMMPAKDNFLLSDALLLNMENSLRRDLLDSAAYLDLDGQGVNQDWASKAQKDIEALDYELGDAGDTPVDTPAAHPSTRDGEYLQRSALYGHQYLSGGAGEGKQHLGPDGTLENHKQVKTDAALPAYCTPPNPCPVGYAAEDGCLEEFENSAPFSRKFQADQDCMCDNEHMFHCPNAERTNSRNDLSEVDMDRLVQQIQAEGEHKTLVAKKFHSKKSGNPYLEGERLPVAAKKGYNV